MRSRVAGVALGGFIALLSLSGCMSMASYKYEATTDTAIEDVTVPKAPVGIVLEISPGIQQYEVIEPVKGPFGNDFGKARFRIGKALAQGIERTFRSVFDYVVVTDGSHVVNTSVPVVATVVPEVELATMHMAAPADEEGSQFLVRVKYKAVDAQGRVVWVDTYQGEGKKREVMFHPVYDDCMKIGLEALFRATQLGLVQSKWWEPLQRQ